MATGKLTVLQVLPALESGGVEKGTLEIAQALVEAGHRSLVMSAGGRLVNQLVKAGSEHIQWPIGVKSLKTLFLVKKLRKFLLEQNIDVVHARSRLPAWIVYLAWKSMNPATRPKFVTTVHGFNSVNWYSKIMTKGEVVIAVSNSVKGFILKSYPDTDPAKITVIHRGVDPNEYPYGYRPPKKWLEQFFANYPQLKNKKILTLPGRITRLKGHEDFIQVIKTLIKRDPDIVGVIAGGYEEKKKDFYEELVEQVNQQGLKDKIIFIGHRTDMREVLAVSDIVLSLTQKPESFGRTTLEALSMGVPVVGYDYGGVGEQLDRLYPSGRCQSGKTSRLLDLIDDKLNQKKVAVEENHTFLIRNMQMQTIQVYQEI